MAKENSKKLLKRKLKMVRMNNLVTYNNTREVQQSLIPMTTTIHEKSR